MSNACQDNIINVCEIDSDFKRVSKMPNNQGKCYLKWEDGSEYMGEFNNKKMNGYGIYKFSDNTIYEGYFRNGCKHGTGKIEYSNGSVYKGDFLNDMPNGNGVLICRQNDSKKDVYIGEITDGIKYGYGKQYVYENEQYILEYIGNWKNDKYNGLGVYYHKNGNKFYEGHFVNGLPQGDGMLYNTKGEKKESSYYIRGVHQADLTPSRIDRLKKKLNSDIRFPLKHVNQDNLDGES